jgi:hypothetical protein
VLRVLLVCGTREGYGSVIGLPAWQLFFGGGHKRAERESEGEGCGECCFFVGLEGA